MRRLFPAAEFGIIGSRPPRSILPDADPNGSDTRQAHMTVHPRLMIVVAPVLLAVLVGLAPCAEGQTGPGQERSTNRDAADKDFGAELPRFPLKDPAESQRALVPRPGFHVDLVAAEPLVRSLVAIEFDEDGRLYVAEFPEYNQYADEDGGLAGDLRSADGRGPETRAARAEVASACWRILAASASTTRARSSPTTCRWRPPSSAGTAASMWAPRRT